MKKKILSLLLALVMVIGLIPAVAAAADEGSATNDPAPRETESMYLAKRYDPETGMLTLEAYAKGEVVISETMVEVPCDIVLVLDTSSSMNDSMKVTRERWNSSSRLSYNQANDGKHYYKSGDNYYLVQGRTTPGALVWTADTTSDNPGDLFDSGSVVSSQTLAKNKNSGVQYYLLVDGEYREAYYTVSREWALVTWGYYFTFYYNDNGTYRTPDGYSEIGATLGSVTLYTTPRQETATTYELYYVDGGGVEHSLATGTNATSSIYNNTLYTKGTYQDNVDKIDALKNAANEFIDVVAKKSMGEDGIAGTEDDVSHKIGIVSFSDNATRQSDLLDVSVAANVTTLKGKVTGLRASGNTYPDRALTEAQSIFDGGNARADAVKTCVLFTDGAPAAGGANWTDNICSDALATAKTMKAAEISMYAIGVFESESANIRNYMNGVSSNYPDAAYTRSGSGYYANYNWDLGTGSDQGYYRTASDADELTEIFKTVAQKSASGGAATTLSDKTEMLDIVAPYFKLPDNVSGEIKVYTADYNAATEQFAARVESTEITATPDTENGTVSLTGFDFTAHWCGPNAEDGQKVILEFPIEMEKGVKIEGETMILPTNGEGSAIYDGGQLIATFPIPTVDVSNQVFHVWHSSDQTTDTYTLPDGTFNLVELVKGTNLYGGYYKDESVAGADNAYTTSGMVMSPEGGTTYYLKEVNNRYLRPQMYNVHMSTYHLEVLKGLYPITAVDSKDYQAVGFDFVTGDDGATDAHQSSGDKVAEKLTVTNGKFDKDLGEDVFEKDSSSEYTAANTFGLTGGGYLYVASIPGETIENSHGLDFPENILFTPFWVTYDNVKVTGLNQFKATNTTDKRSGLSQELAKVPGTTTDVTPVVNAAPRMMMKSLSVFPSFNVSEDGLTAVGEPEETVVPVVEPEEPVVEPVVEPEEPAVEPEEPAVEPEEPAVEPEEPVVEPEEPAEEPEEVIEPEEPAVVEYAITKMDGKSKDMQVVEPGNQVGKITYTEKKNQMFAGWFADAACTVPADFSDVQADMTVYAKYVKPSVSVVAGGKRGSSVILSGTVTVKGASFAEVGFDYNFKGQDGKAVASVKNAGLVKSLLNKLTGKSGEAEFAGEWSLNLTNRATFTAAPYWVTLDGTVVTGAASTYSYTLGFVVEK